MITKKNNNIVDFKMVKKENGNIVYVKMLKRRMAKFDFDHKNPDKYFVLWPKVLSIQIKWHFGLGCFFLKAVKPYYDVYNGVITKFSYVL